MSPESALAPIALTNRRSPLDAQARLFWLASQATRDLIRDGKLERADLMLRMMASAGNELINGPQTGRSLGRQMLRTVSELTIQYIGERAGMAAALIATIPERGQ
jgi:hypothetical protein